MATNAELEQIVRGLEKSLNEAVSAIRNLAQQSNQNAAGIAKLADDLNKVRGDLAQQKVALTRVASNGGAAINKYE